jgi:hypothetical protein
MTLTRRMRKACWITKVTDTQSEYAILVAHPRQLWLREHTTMLRLYVYCLALLLLPQSRIVDTSAKHG